MTAVTINFEDNIFARLKQSAESVGYTLDRYILHVLSRNYRDEDFFKKKNDDVDALLRSMQFDGVNIPDSEDGKGAVAYMKYM